MIASKTPFDLFDNREYSYLQMYIGLLWSIFLIGHVYLSGICASLIKRHTQSYYVENRTGQKGVNLAKKGVKI